MSDSPYLVPPGRKLDLSKIDTASTGDFKAKADAAGATADNLDQLRKLQRILYAEAKRSVLIVVQAMDTGGKDGAIKHVFGGVNPQGCSVTSFKAPSAHELAHDYLWRIHAAAPARGMIGIFNRSHYEDVLVARVHDLVPKHVWQRRYDQINAFEELLADAGTTVLKFFLHISKDEQKRRLQSRLDDPKKFWKFDANDLAERGPVGRLPGRLRGRAPEVLDAPRPVVRGAVRPQMVPQLGHQRHDRPCPAADGPAVPAGAGRHGPDQDRRLNPLSGTGVPACHG